MVHLLAQTMYSIWYSSRSIVLHVSQYIELPLCEPQQLLSKVCAGRFHLLLSQHSRSGWLQQQKGSLHRMFYWCIICQYYWLFLVGLQFARDTVESPRSVQCTILLLLYLDAVEGNWYLINNIGFSQRGYRTTIPNNS